MKTVLIVSGGNISKDLVCKNLSKDEIFAIIAVDKGLEILNDLNIEPTDIIGDFDSVSLEILNKYINSSCHIHKYQSEKDFTDTEAAIEIAIKKQPEQIILLGATGTRLDHTLANIHIMKKILDHNIVCKNIDTNNEILLIDKNFKLEKNNNYKYISLIPLTSVVTGITLKGFKYSLNNAILNIGQSLGISNEQLEKEAFIDIQTGILIIMQSKD